MIVFVLRVFPREFFVVPDFGAHFAGVLFQRAVVFVQMKCARVVWVNTQFVQATGNFDFIALGIGKIFLRGGGVALAERTHPLPWEDAPSVPDGVGIDFFGAVAHGVNHEGADFTVCPHCEGRELRIKDSFVRTIRNVPVQGKPSRLQVKCHKYQCTACGRYFNTRLDGVKPWSRTTELLKREIFRTYNKGVCCKDIATDNAIGVASVERYYHQMMQHTASHWQNRDCPCILGIDEHRFTRKQGFATTFCDLAKHRVFDVVKGRSAKDMEYFLGSLRGHNKVQVVCIDMNSAYRKLAREWFPNARIVTDRFHVVRLVNQHFSELCKIMDEKHLAYGRGGLMRLMLKRATVLMQCSESDYAVILRVAHAWKPFITLCMI